MFQDSEKKMPRRQDLKSLADPSILFQLTRNVTYSPTRTRTWIQTRASLNTDINLSGFYSL